MMDQMTPLFWGHIIKAALTYCRDQNISNELVTKRMLSLCERIDNRSLPYKDFVSELHWFTTTISDDELIWQLPKYIKANQLDIVFVYILAAKDLKQALNDRNRMANTSLILC